MAVYKEFSKKAHFRFFKRTRSPFQQRAEAYIVLNKSFSNFFITLLDLRGKVVVLKALEWHVLVIRKRKS